MGGPSARGKGGGRGGGGRSPARAPPRRGGGRPPPGAAKGGEGVVGRGPRGGAQPARRGVAPGRGGELRFPRLDTIALRARRPPRRVRGSEDAGEEAQRRLLDRQRVGGAALDRGEE